MHYKNIACFQKFILCQTNVHPILDFLTRRGKFILSFLDFYLFFYKFFRETYLKKIAAPDWAEPSRARPSARPPSPSPRRRPPPPGVHGEHGNPGAPFPKPPNPPFYIYPLPPPLTPPPAPNPAAARAGSPRRRRLAPSPPLADPAAGAAPRRPTPAALAAPRGSTGAPPELCPDEVDLASFCRFCFKKNRSF